MPLPTGSTVRLQLLGPVRVTPGGSPDAPSLLSQPRRLALLAYLTLARPRGFHSRESLMALLWPDAGQDEGRHALRNALHAIRKSLGAQVIRTEGDGLVAVDRSRIQCDAIDLEHDLSVGRGEAAMASAYGRLMEGFHVADAWQYAEWLDQERQRLDDLALGAIRRASELLEQRGDQEGALAAARRACELAPYDERVHRRLIELLDRQGEGAAAMAAYRAFAKRLERELGVTPSPSVASMAREIAARAPRAAPPAAGAGYIHYVRGTYLFLRAAHQGHPEDLAGSRTHFEAALAQDPSFAPALAGLSNYYAVAAARGVLRPFDEVFGEAIALSHRALALDCRLAIPHVHFGVQAMYLDGDWERAGREFAQAVALEPTYAEARRFLGIWYDATGKPDEALAELREAVLLEPLIAMFRNSLAAALMDREEWEAALRELERARELDPFYQAARERLVRCVEELGRYELALAERERVPVIGPAGELRAAFTAEGAAGYRRVLHQELRSQVPALAARARDWPPAHPADRFVPPAVRLAAIHARLGDHVSARECEETACRARPWLRPWFRSQSRS
ncbi:MAG TPA: BTAD domain-containing putative transcriptional regulator [Gemmatimonadales bacterium]|nr:BTAD domain-containing putative transcriptional regulator [Gemmatimonadales bacterium]